MNIEEYKQLYRNSSSESILKEMDKNEVLRKYVETGDEKYLSAAIYKFWYILNNKIYNNKNNIFIGVEDMYEMYIDSILKTCKNKLWLKESHSLYNDKKAPEKSINTIFNSKIINYFHACNRQKRKSNYNKISITNNDYIYHTSGFNLHEEMETTMFDEKMKSMIVDFFNKKDYYSSYILDIILTKDIFNKKNEQLNFNRKKLKHYLMTLDNVYCDYFAMEYGLEKTKVENSLKYINQYSYTSIESKIDNSLKNLSRNTLLKGYLNL